MTTNYIDIPLIKPSMLGVHILAINKKYAFVQKIIKVLVYDRYSHSPVCKHVNISNGNR